LETVAPRSFQERTKYVQDFAKHGFKDLGESTPYDMEKAASLMLVSIVQHEEIFGQKTPLMALYSTRTLTDYPEWIKMRGRTPKSLLGGGVIEKVGQGKRKQCLDRFLPVFVEVASSLHLG
jgi:hypothetical protein